jgi:DNA mismatch endonuclease (patch repair protein)
MAAIRRKNTKPEMAVRSILHAAGLRYRCDLRVELAERAVRPDIVFTRRKVAVFIDGCFWHSCPQHGAMPKKNIDYWQAKLARNRERDIADTVALQSAGWTVIRGWEHTTPQELAVEVQRAVTGGA